MNAVARIAITRNPLFKGVSVNFYLPEFKVSVLAFLLLISCVGVVYVKDLNRRMFISYQSSQAQNSQLHSDSKKLLLEQGAWGSQARVQMVAQKKLQMQIPRSSDTLMIKL